MLDIKKVSEALFINDNEKLLFILEVYPETPRDILALDQFDTLFQSFIETSSPRQLQIILAPFLRAAAIRHLRYGMTPHIEQARLDSQEILASDPESGGFESFLQIQMQNRIHATYLEAMALGDLLGLNIITTPITNVVTDISFQTTEKRIGSTGNIHLDDQNNQTIHFFCEDNRHWYIYENGYYETLPDGNCLYNGFAQWIRRLVSSAPNEGIEKVIALNQYSLLTQDKISPDALREQVLNAKTLNEKLDHHLALQLAHEQMTSIHALRKTLEVDMQNAITNEDKLRILYSLCKNLRESLKTTNITYHRILQNLEACQAFVAQHPQLITLYTAFFKSILDAFSIPDTTVEGTSWTMSTYNEAIKTIPTLLQSISEDSPKPFQNLVWSMQEINFKEINPDNIDSSQHSASQNRVTATKNTHTIAPESIIPALRMAGIALMILSVITLVTLLLCTLLPHAMLLIGPNFISMGLYKSMIAMGLNVGKSQFAISSILGISTTAIGYRLFKASHNENAPQNNPPTIPKSVIAP